ncbi:MAG: ABC transporter permease, partial [Gaiellaceae bacterium]
MTEDTPTPAPAEPAFLAAVDERLVHVSVLARLLARPDIGALVGAIAVFFSFAYFARGVNWIGDLGNASVWS